MKLCDYGCGREAKHQFKNGKWCCENTTNKCPEVRRKNSENNEGKVCCWKGKKHSKEYKKLMSRVLKGRIISKESRKKMSNSHKGKIISLQTRQKMQKSRIGKNNPMYGNKITLKEIQKRYPFFCKIEEIKQGPEKGLFFVHCKNHNCSNSKEKGGWFLTSYKQIYERIRALENADGNGGQYLYCSDRCKKECPLFKLKSDPCRNTEKSYTHEEYQIFRKFVLERDNYVCQFCGKPAEHVHHERPQKLEPFFALDPDLSWSCCEKCHYKYGHSKATECSTGNLASRMCG